MAEFFQIIGAIVVCTGILIGFGVAIIILAKVRKEKLDKLDSKKLR